ncbi:MAG: simple sugar transport system substrate-binding protein [Candidatus Atribacteria bacterium]|nr:simple sugar transport system substrate-binding protein [Candidatus Atribacteria bacterium]
MVKKILSTVLVFTLIAGFMFFGAQPKAVAQDLVFATVVKSVAFNWFLRMEEGILQFGEDYGVTTFMEGPSVADSAQQIAVIENLIPQGIDALINVPHGVKEQEPVQKKAMDAGIIVITHEASFVENAHYDLEAFDNKAYGEEMMRELATRMGEKGKYVQFVGSLTNASHNEWMDAALAYQQEHYPEMESIGRYESKDDQEVAYNTMKDLLKTYSDIRGVLGSAAGDVVGAGRAIEEMGLSDQIAVVGTSIPSYAGELLKTGAVDLAMTWDPATAGYAANVVAYKIIQGEEITEGMDLGVPGYESIKIIENENGVPVIYGSGWAKIDATNMDQYPF